MLLTRLPRHDHTAPLGAFFDRDRLSCRNITLTCCRLRDNLELIAWLLEWFFQSHAQPPNHFSECMKFQVCSPCREELHFKSFHCSVRVMAPGSPQRTLVTKRCHHFGLWSKVTKFPAYQHGVMTVISYERDGLGGDCSIWDVLLVVWVYPLVYPWRVLDVWRVVLWALSVIDIVFLFLENIVKLWLSFCGSSTRTAVLRWAVRACEKVKHPVWKVKHPE